MSKQPKKPGAKADEPDILVCSRASAGAEILPRSVWDECRECGASVWIAVAGQQAMKRDPKMVPMCLECVGQKHKDNPDIKVETAPGAMQELQRYFAQRKKHCCTLTI